MLGGQHRERSGPGISAAPITVLHVLGSLDRGGVETVSLDLCRAVPGDEVRQVFLTLGGREGRLAPRVRALGATVHQCRLTPRATFPVRLWLSIYRHRPDAVVSHVSLVSGLVLAVAAVAGVGVRIARLSSESDGRADTVSRRCTRAVLRWLLRRCATSVVGTSPRSLAFAQPRAEDPRYVVVPRGIEVDRFAATNPRGRRPWPPTLGYVGRAAPEKNRGFLVHVHRSAKRLCPDTSLLVCGPGGVADLVAVDPGVLTDPSVLLVGETDEVEKVFARFDVLLLPSHREGLPGVVLEALAGGVPVVTSALPGLCDLAGQLPGLTTVPLSAGPDMWATAALRMAALPPEERARISAAMRCSSFDFERSVRAWRALWSGAGSVTET